jgi:hypothetical protein
MHVLKQDGNNVETGARMGKLVLRFKKLVGVAAGVKNVR